MNVNASETGRFALLSALNAADRCDDCEKRRPACLCRRCQGCSISRAIAISRIRYLNDYFATVPGLDHRFPLAGGSGNDRQHGSCPARFRHFSVGDHAGKLTPNDARLFNRIVPSDPITSTGTRSAKIRGLLVIARSARSSNPIVLRWDCDRSASRVKS